MSDTINIDCTASELRDTVAIKDEVIKKQQQLLGELQGRIMSLNRMVERLSAELEELHARHRPKEDQ